MALEKVVIVLQLELKFFEEKYYAVLEKYNTDYDSVI